jgi:cytoskeletal protein RodZ
MKTLGVILKEYREKSGMTIARFSEITKISQKSIIELESDNFDVLDAYDIPKYISIYARYLNLDKEKLVLKYKDQVGIEASKQQTSNHRPEAQPSVILTPKMLKVFGIVLVGLLVIGYLFFQVTQIFEEPYLEVTTPAEDIVITDNFIDIRGRTEREATIYINDKEVTIDAKGFFVATLDLTDGINLIKISAQKKHSKQSVIYREILVQ